MKNLEPELLNKISELVYQNAGGSEITEHVADVEYRGITHQVHLTVTTDDWNFIEDTEPPKYRFSDGDLIRINPKTKR